ncbi:MAG: ABC transporter permease [Actinomycetota bacterium]|nr:ABC transporter permease [Actinomycetota bacterium]
MAQETGAKGSRRGAVGLPRWFWPSFALPGVGWLLLFFVVPFYAILSVAMGKLDPIFSTATPEWNPIKWNPDSFGEVLQSPELQGVLFRTVVYVAAAGIIALLVGYPVAYYIARHGGRFKTLLLVLLIAPFWISYLMRMLAWVNLLQDDGYVNQILMFFNLLDAPRAWLSGEPSTVILGLVYGYIPFLILPLFAALDRIDTRVMEAARDLGASPMRTFWHVTMPLSKQGILAGLVIILLPMFGDYYTPDLLSGVPRTSMIGNQVNFFIHSGTGGNRGAAIVIILSALVSLLMVYYLVTVAKAAREART